MANDYTSVIRPATSDEKKDFIEVNPSRKLPYKELKMRRIREVEKELHANHQPFDRYSALLGLNDAIEDFVREHRRKVGKDVEALETALHGKDFFDEKTIRSYGDINRFILKEAKKIYTEKVMDGVKVPVQDRMEVIFKAKKRGNEICFHMYNEEYAEKYVNKKTEAPKPASPLNNSTPSN